MDGKGKLIGLLLALFCAFYFAQNVSADLTFDPVSPSVYNEGNGATVVSCSVGTNFGRFKCDENDSGGFNNYSCGATLNPAGYGSPECWIIVESSEDSWEATIAEERLYEHYIGEEQYVFEDSAVGMTTFTLPPAGDMVAGISAYSAPIFVEYLPIVWIPVALFATACGLVWLMGRGNGFFSRLLGGKKKYSKSNGYKITGNKKGFYFELNKKKWK